MSDLDLQLIARANNGEAAAFEALYERHRAWVLRVALRYVGDEQAALDVVQDVFLYWLRQFPGFELRARVTTYLFPVTRSIALTTVRQRRPVAGTELDTLEHPAATGDALPDDLGEILGTLPNGQREVLLLRFVDGFTIEEIGTALAIPLGTVKSRLHHALQRLREDPRTGRYFED